MTMGRPKKYTGKMYRKPQLLDKKESKILIELAKQYGVAQQRVLSALIEQKTQSNLPVKTVRRIASKLGLE